MSTRSYPVPPRRNTVTSYAAGAGTSQYRAATLSARAPTPQPQPPAPTTRVSAVEVAIPRGVFKLVFLNDPVDSKRVQIGAAVRDPAPGLHPLPAGASLAEAYLYDGTTQILRGRRSLVAAEHAFGTAPASAGQTQTQAIQIQAWTTVSQTFTPTPRRDERDAPTLLPVIPASGSAVYRVPTGLALACDDLLAIASLSVKPDGPGHSLVSVSAGPSTPVRISVRSGSGGQSSASPSASSPPAPAPVFPPPSAAPAISTSPGTGCRRRAVVVGVSAYRMINSLEYADDDAVSWTRYLQSRGYEVRLLGDGKSDYSPYTPHDVATEHNVRAAMQWLAVSTRPGDRAAIITSGHGGGDGKGSSWICCVDETGTTPHGMVEDGSYTDVEMCSDAQRILAAGAAGLFIFLDNCYSGGVLDDAVAGLPQDRFFLCSTCSDHGYGFDEAKWKHGAWTHCFLIRTLDGALGQVRYPELGQAFDKAIDIYPYASDPANRPASGGNRQLTL